MQVVENADLYEVACNENKTSLPIFYTPAWLDTVIGKQHWQPYIIIEDSVVRAIFPICIRKKFGFKAIIMPPLTPYLALWIFDEKDIHKYTTYLAACLQQMPSALVTSMSPHHTNTDTSIWTSLGYNITIKNTYTFSFQPYEDIYRNYPNTMKRDLKRAAEKLTIQEQSNVDDLYEMIGHTYATQKINKPITKQLINHINQNTNFNPKIFSAIHHNTVVAAIMTISDQSWTYYILSGRSKEAPHGTIAVLIDHAIKTALNEHHHFDFEGSSIEGIAKFFKSFSPQHHPYFHAQKYKNIIIKKLLTKPKN